MVAKKVVTFLLWFACGVMMCFLAYSRGYKVAETAGKLELAELRLQYEQTFSKAVIAAKEHQEAIYQQYSELETELLHAQAQLEKERKAQRKRIDDAVEKTRATCSGLSPEWLSLYNDYTRSGGNPGDQSAAAADAANGAGASRPSVSGLSAGQPLITPGDLLTHLRDYGTYCRGIARQNDAWRKWDTRQ
jgi:hypothetical protein